MSREEEKPMTEYAQVATPKGVTVVDEQAITVEEAKPTTSEVQPNFSFFSLYRYADKYDAFLMIVGILMSILNGGFFPVLAVLFGDAISNFTPVNIDAINKTALEFLIIAVALFISGYASYVCFQISAERQMKQLRSACLKHVLYQEMGWYDQRDAGELASRISGDTVKIKEGMGEKLGEALRFLAQFVVGYVIGFSKGWNMSLVMASVMPLMAFSLTFLIKKLKSSAEWAQKVYAKAGAVAEETLGSMRTVASLNGEHRAVSNYNKHVLEAEKENMALAKYVSGAIGWFFMSMWLTYAVGLWYGGYLVSKQNSSVSDPGTVFSAFYAILIGTMSLAQISPNISAVAAAKGASTELFKILARPSKINAASDEGIVLDKCTGAIEAKDLFFAYPSRPEAEILKGYSLNISCGETVALVGASGGGKSTLVALLERFYEPSSGSIYLDGVDISTLQLKWLRQQIGLVSQEPVLFACSIYDNIAAGGDKGSITKGDVINAAKLSNAHDFIMELPNGYDTLVGEKGVNLSGGQKQRVAIARAIVRNPKILVLDEATSALDSVSERIVQKALSDLMNNTSMTTIVIAHRLSTIRNADKIVVINKGVVCEVGPHDDLIKIDRGIYRTLVELQRGSKFDHSDNSDNSENDEESDVNGALNKVEDNKSMDGRIASAIQTIPEHANLVRTYSQHSNSQYRAEEDDKNNNKKKKKKSDKKSTQKDEVKLGRIFELTKPQRMYLILGTIACGLNGFSMPGSAILISSIIDTMSREFGAYIKTKDPSHLTTLYIDVRSYAFYYIGFAIAIFFVGFVQTYSFRIVSEKLTTKLRNMHFKALCRQNIAFFDDVKHSTGALTSDLSTHATKVVVIAGENQGRIIQASFTFLAAVVISFSLGSWVLTLVMLAVFPLLILGTMARSRHMKGFKVSDSLGDSGACATEAIVNVRTVAAFGLETSTIMKYDVLLEAPVVDGSREARINGIALGFSSFSMFAVYALVFWYGGKLVNDGDISFTELIRTLMAIMMSAQGIGQAAGFLGDTDAAKKSAKEIFEIVDRPVCIDSFDESGLKPDTVAGSIRFENVYFNYPTRPNVKVLSNYNLSIEAGQTIAFCGPSGGGKSTGVALLERFYDPQSGSIYLDGNNTKTLNINWLRNQMGLVGQEPVLFVGTIAENIAQGSAYYLNEDNDLVKLQGEIEKCARMANAHDFIMQFPDGYNTQVGLKGEQLSGGQKQRIAIARAIMKNPNILLLDEATSALDSESENIVQDALDKLIALKRRTTIIIAHRLSTIRNADKICVVSGGKVAEEGTHAELFALNGIYTKLVEQSEGK